MTGEHSLSSAFREVVVAARLRGCTLADVYHGMSSELGRTSASLESEEDVHRWLMGFVRETLKAWRAERASITASPQRYGGEARRGRVRP